MSRPLRVLDLHSLRTETQFLYGSAPDSDYYLPQAVLAALCDTLPATPNQAHKQRQAAQQLSLLLARADASTLEQGILLQGGPDSWGSRLYFESTDHFIAYTPQAVLDAAMTAHNNYLNHKVILVTDNLALRLRALALGLASEAHLPGVLLDDPDLLDPGWQELSSAETAHWFGNGLRGPHLIPKSAAPRWLPQRGLFTPSGTQLRVQEADAETWQVAAQQDYARTPVWGLAARNREQNLALNLLLDPQVDLVTLFGPAGSGKTLLALAAGLTQTLELERYQSIVITRATIALGEEIGYLPGTEEEKMTPWMGALLDNLEVLGQPAANQSRWQQAITTELLQERIQVRSLNFMRGRTFLKRFLILDEVQNLTPSQLRTLISRAGPGSKVVCLGNLAQIDTATLTATTSGLAHVIERSQHWAYSGHVLLRQGERSRLADFAATQL